MRRRRFFSLAMAAATAPLMPVALRAAPIAAASQNGIYHYGLAVFHARMHRSLSPEDLGRLMKLSPAQTHEMIARLVADKHIVGGAVPGTYTTANPYVRNPAIAKRARAQAAERQRDALRRTEGMMAYLNRIADHYFAVSATGGATV